MDRGPLCELGPRRQVARDRGDAGSPGESSGPGGRPAGLELVRGCDALVYDRLVASELVAEAPADALAISRDGLDQEQINALLIDLASQGFEVVRLKGGDPFVFGRGGEEALALAEANVPFEVVPGVSDRKSVV